MLIQADKIRRRVGDDRKDRTLSTSLDLNDAKAAQARLDKGGCLERSALLLASYFATR